MVNEARIKAIKKYTPREEPPGDTEDRQDHHDKDTTDQQPRPQREDDRGRQKSAPRRSRSRPARPR